MDNKVIEIQKPMTVRREEFKNNMIELINKSDMYAFMVEAILVELLEQTRMAMQAQYQRELTEYNKQVEENNMKEE